MVSSQESRVTLMDAHRSGHSFPIVAQGEADFVLGFELLEAARALPYLKEDGTVIVNEQKILPMPVITGAMAYPENPLAWLEGHPIIAADAQKIALECGNIRTMNTVLLGMLSTMLPFSAESWEQVIGMCVPRKTLPANIAAFERGRAIRTADAING